MDSPFISKNCPLKENTSWNFLNDKGDLFDIFNIKIDRKIVTKSTHNNRFVSECNILEPELRIINLYPCVYLLFSTIINRDLNYDEKIDFISKRDFFGVICDTLEITIYEGMEILRYDNTALGENIFNDFFKNNDKEMKWPSKKQPPNWDEIKKNIEMEQPFEILGKYIINPLKKNTHNYIIFDKDRNYRLIPTILKDILNTYVYFIVDDEEILKRSRKVFYFNKLLEKGWLPQDISYKILKWDNIADLMYSINTKNHQEIASKYGMLLFEEKYTNINTILYVITFIGEAYFSDKSDEDVLLEAGIFIPFLGHNSLIQSIEYLKHNVGFFVILTDIMAKKAQNQNLMTLETVMEACPDVVIGHGTLFEYKAMSIAELTLSFRDDPLDPNFYIPYNYTECFSNKEIENIQSLLKYYKYEHSDVSNLLNKIENIYKLKSALSQTISSFYSYLKNTNEKEQIKIGNIFRNIFYAGMYMRQWKGGKNKFPIKEYETLLMSKNDDLSFQINVTKHLKKSLDFISEVNNIHLKKLPVLTFNEKGIFCDYSFELYNFLLNLADDNYCIRMGSLPLISTSIYYHKLFKIGKIPDIDLSKIESIF